MTGNESGEISTANTMRERTGKSRPVAWFLLDGDRMAVTAVLAATVFVGFVLFGAVVQPPLLSSLRGADTVETIFSTMIGILVTGTTLVVSISQLVISQENGPLGDQRKRMSDAMDFRTYAGELFESTPPADPSAFLRELVGTSRQRADAVGRLVAENDDADLRKQVEEFLDSLRGNADVVESELEDSQFGHFDVLVAALNFNYSWKIYQIERITDEFAETLNEDERTAFRQLHTSLTMFGPAREQIKTLYFQWALVDLSRYILYAAVPALVIAGGMLTFVGEATFSGAILGLPTVTWVVALAFTATLVPFLLFASYIFRIVSIAKRTLAIGPLVLRDSQD